jgi:predicted acetyltransferase
MLDDFDTNDPYNSEFYAPARAGFRAYVQSLEDEEAGVNLREGYVPCTHRWLLSPTGQVIGVARVRHRIDTPFLAQHGGHVGYDIAPSMRRRGYGHFAMSVALLEARRLGITRLLLCASEDNAPSRAVIERAGGILESTSHSEYWNERLCKYWVTVPAEA